jgi:hypothetical protein
VRARHIRLAHLDDGVVESLRDGGERLAELLRVIHLLGEPPTQTASEAGRSPQHEVHRDAEAGVGLTEAPLRFTVNDGRIVLEQVEEPPLQHVAQPLVHLPVRQIARTTGIVQEYLIEGIHEILRFLGQCGENDLVNALHAGAGRH